MSDQCETPVRDEYGDTVTNLECATSTPAGAPPTGLPDTGFPVDTLSAIAVGIIAVGLAARSMWKGASGR